MDALAGTNLTATLALDRHQERQQQLIVMEERATIARELHDSIAQSLSCMKMQVSCLQMQGDALPESSRELLSQIRNELNASRAQLRESAHHIPLAAHRAWITSGAGGELRRVQRQIWLPGEAGLSIAASPWCLRIRQSTCCKLPVRH